MVGELVGLKIRLLRSGLRRSPMRAVGFVVGAVLLVLGGVAAGALMAATGLAWTSRAQDVGIVTTCVMALVALQWYVVPILATGLDETLDPARFALFPVTARRLLPGLVVSSLVGPAGVAQLLLTLGFVLAWVRTPVAALAALVFGLLGSLSAVVGTRALSTAVAAAAGGRRWRDATSMVAVLLSATLGVWINLISSRISSVEAARAEGGLLAQVLAWTPLGAAWAVPWDVATGRWGLAAAHGAVAVVTCLALLWVWRRALDARLTSPPASGVEGTVVRGAAWYDRFLPDTRAGAVMQRALRYWARDPRYLMSLGMALLMPVLMVVPGLLASPEEPMPAEGRALLPFVALATAWACSIATMQDTSYDGSPFSLHVLSGMRGRDDRWGRALPVLLWAVPLTLVLVTVGAIAVGDWRWWPLAAGLSLAVIGAGVGAGQWTSAMWQFPAPPPGANQFANPPGSTLATFLALLVCTVTQVAVCVPVLVLGVWGYDSPVAQGAALLLGAALGAGVLALGVRLGGRQLDRAWPEILGRVTERAG